MQVVEGVVREIETQVADIEPDFEEHRQDMTEEVRGKVLAAIGKARLLISQKIQQFQGLCYKNIVSNIVTYVQTSYSVTMAKLQSYF